MIHFFFICTSFIRSMSRSKNQYIWTFSNPAFDFKSAACSLVNFLFPFLEPLSLPNSPSVPWVLIKVVCDAINASLTLYNCSEYNCSDYFACSTYPNTDGATIASSIASMTSTTIISTNVNPFFIHVNNSLIFHIIPLLSILLKIIKEVPPSDTGILNYPVLRGSL